MGRDPFAYVDFYYLTDLKKRMEHPKIGSWIQRTVNEVEDEEELPAILKELIFATMPLKAIKSDADILLNLLTLLITKDYDKIETYLVMFRTYDWEKKQLKKLLQKLKGRDVLGLLLEVNGDITIITKSNEKERANNRLSTIKPKTYLPKPLITSAIKYALSPTEENKKKLLTKIRKQKEKNQRGEL